ncbi:hypothetical protein QTP88_013220 [Uroleucon formosanum]
MIDYNNRTKKINSMTYHMEDVPPEFRSMPIDNDNILQLSIIDLRQYVTIVMMKQILLVNTSN